MTSHPRPALIFLLFCLSLITDAAVGQSLSFTRRNQNEFWITTTAPQDSPYMLQVSENLSLWVDINDDVRGQASNRVNSTGITNRFFRLTPWTPPAPDITVMLIGDSTVADFVSNNNWFNGWGQGIYGYFKSNARVVNLAYPGYSTKVFLASAEKTKMLAIKPEYVLVQFGLIDEFGVKETQWTSLTEFADNLKTIVQAIRGFNGIPILITPPASRFWDAQGKIYPVYQDRFAVIKTVADELQVHFVNLNRLSIDLYNSLGKSGCADLQWGDDYLHFTDKGARLVAGLVVNGLPGSLGPYLVGLFDQVLLP
jgi:lysophospholipase L1-like esterase